MCVVLGGVHVGGGKGLVAGAGGGPWADGEKWPDTGINTGSDTGINMGSVSRPSVQRTPPAQSRALGEGGVGGAHQ